MRLGGWYRAGSAEEPGRLREQLDCRGLSVIPAPTGLAGMTDNACPAFGERARELDLVAGEFGCWENLLTPDPELRAQRGERPRTLPRRADLMGCRSVVTLVGTRDPSGKATAPHPHLFSDACQEGLRELVPRLLDGLDPRTTKYPTEPRLTSFFYQPRAIRRFLGRLDHPARGVHLDQMNLVGWATFYRTSELIGETLGQPADRVHGVHLKDIRWNWRHQGLKRDEVAIAGGVLDYPAYPRRLAELPPDTPCYRGHFAEERDDAPSFARLHHLAERAGAPFHRRGADRSDAVRAA